MYEGEDERELITFEYAKDNPEFKRYCFCMKELYDTRECTCNYCMLWFGSPFILAIDAIAFIPQVIINNIKLCFI